jgi:hypothetical protein
VFLNREVYSLGLLALNIYANNEVEFIGLQSLSPRRSQRPSFLVSYYGRGHLRRTEGRMLGDHLSAIKRYCDTVAGLL